MAGDAAASAEALARRLLAHAKQAGGESAAVFRVCEKMREPLVKLMGTSGFHSLFSRALAVTGAQISWLRKITVAPDGSLSGLEEATRALSARDRAAGEQAVTKEFLRLLVTFIGPVLTDRLIRDTWPKFSSAGF